MNPVRCAIVSVVRNGINLSMMVWVSSAWLNYVDALGRLAFCRDEIWFSRALSQSSFWKDQYARAIDVSYKSNPALTFQSLRLSYKCSRTLTSTPLFLHLHIRTRTPSAPFATYQSRCSSPRSSSPSSRPLLLRPRLPRPPRSRLQSGLPPLVLPALRELPLAARLLLPPEMPLRLSVRAFSMESWVPCLHLSLRSDAVPSRSSVASGQWYFDLLLGWIEAEYDVFIALIPPSAALPTLLVSLNLSCDQMSCLIIVIFRWNPYRYWLHPHWCWNLSCAIARATANLCTSSCALKLNDKVMLIRCYVVSGTISEFTH